jgi:hypothetical protein
MAVQLSERAKENLQRNSESRKKDSKFVKLEPGEKTTGEFVRYSPYFEGHMKYIKEYYVRIKKSSGEGFANDWEGFLTVSTDEIINYSPTVWHHADVRKYNIGGQMDLMLFKMDADKRTITFPRAKIDQGYVEYSHYLEDFLQSELAVHVNTGRGRVNGDFSKSIQSIIDDAKPILVNPPKS